MLKIGQVGKNSNICFGNTITTGTNKSTVKPEYNNNKGLTTPTAENFKAYAPLFGKIGRNNSEPTDKDKFNTIKAQLDSNTIKKLKSLEQKGILADNKSNDGSTVLDNLYKMATEPRIIGLSTSELLTEVITTLDNPFSITQKFGDIPDEVAEQIEQETGEKFP
ncbi:hypothetical protein II906_05555, partial [bacterium]|nr:hypothetical protein [bacterium]